MPGKHAPGSPRSFYFSVARAVGAGIAIVAVVAGVVLVAFGGDGEKAAGTSTPSPTLTATSSSSPSPSATATATPTATASPSPAASTLASTQITVEVLNATTTPGLAAATRERVTAAGYRVTRVGNAPTVASSTIYFRRGMRAEAAALQRLFPEFGALAEAQGGQTVMMRMVIGSDFPGASPSPTATPSG